MNIELIKIAENQLRIIELKNNMPSHNLDIYRIDKFEYGILVIYCLTMFIKTGDDSYSLGGNAPFIIDKYSKTVIETNTSFSPQTIINLYCRYRNNLERFNYFIRLKYRFK